MKGTEIRDELVEQLTYSLIAVSVNPNAMNDPELKKIKDRIVELAQMYTDGNYKEDE